MCSRMLLQRVNAGVGINRTFANMAAARTTEGFLDFTEGRVFFKKWSPVKGLHHDDVPIVLMHESLGCVDMWRDFPDNLAEKTKRQVIAYDRLGYGRSSAQEGLPPLDFIKKEGEEFLPRVLDALKVKRCVLFGHSVGGGMVIHGAAKLGDRCAALISEAAQAFVNDYTREGVRRAEKEFENPKLRSRLEKFHGNKTQWTLDAWIETWCSPDFADWSLRDVLPRVRSPMLVLHGENDMYGPKEYADMIASLSGGRTEKHIIPNCNHIPHREQAEVTLNIIGRFLDHYVPPPSKY